MSVITTSQVLSRSPAGVAPVPITPQATDTIPANLFGPTGLTGRLITTGTACTVTVTDPGKTPLNNAGVSGTVVGPATGVREFFIPTAAIDPGPQQATLGFSGALTGVSYELYKA
jgi:hypothetical protein